MAEKGAAGRSLGWVLEGQRMVESSLRPGYGFVVVRPSAPQRRDLRLFASTSSYLSLSSSFGAPSPSPVSAQARGCPSLRLVCQVCVWR